MLKTVFEKLDNLDFDLLGNLERTVADVLVASCFDEYEIANDKILKNYTEHIKQEIRVTSPLINTLKKENSKYQNFFVYQPYGIRRFPDFLVFTEKFIYAIEVKSHETTSDNKNFKMNGTYPQGNYIYIYGSSTEKKITYCLGKFYVEEQGVERINKEWEQIEKFYEEINQKRIADGEKILFYPRKTFKENLELKEGLFSASTRNNNEKIVKEFVENSEKSKIEDNVA